MTGQWSDSRRNRRHRLRPAACSRKLVVGLRVAALDEARSSAEHHNHHRRRCHRQRLSGLSPVAGLSRRHMTVARRHSVQGEMPEERRNRLRRRRRRQHTLTTGHPNCTRHIKNSRCILRLSYDLYNNYTNQSVSDFIQRPKYRPRKITTRCSARAARSILTGRARR